MKPKIRLVYFSGCPRAPDAKLAIEGAGIVIYDVVVQDGLPANHADRRYSSPSILIGDLIAYGGLQDGAGACSAGRLSSDRILELLKES